MKKNSEIRKMRRMRILICQDSNSNGDDSNCEMQRPKALNNTKKKIQ